MYFRSALLHHKSFIHLTTEYILYKWRWRCLIVQNTWMFDRPEYLDVWSSRIPGCLIVQNTCMFDRPEYLYVWSSRIPVCLIVQNTCMTSIFGSNSMLSVRLFFDLFYFCGCCVRFDFCIGIIMCPLLENLFQHWQILFVQLFFYQGIGYSLFILSLIKGIGYFLLCLLLMKELNDPCSLVMNQRTGYLLLVPLVIRQGTSLSGSLGRDQKTWNLLFIFY